MGARFQWLPAAAAAGEQTDRPVRLRAFLASVSAAFFQMQGDQFLYVAHLFYRCPQAECRPERLPQCIRAPAFPACSSIFTVGTGQHQRRGTGGAADPFPKEFDRLFTHFPCVPVSGDPVPLQPRLAGLKIAGCSSHTALPRVRKRRATGLDSICGCRPMGQAMDHRQEPFRQTCSSVAASI